MSNTASGAITPVISPISPSSSTKSAKLPPNTSTYLNYLASTYTALAHIVKEAPASREGSPAAEERVDALRKCAVEAFEHASGNPADGKWGVLSQTLRMPVTRGRYRWIGARADRPVSLPQPGPSGWINAETEAEWFEWEKKRKGEEVLKQKVENWKKNVMDSDSVLQIEVDMEEARESKTADDSKGSNVEKPCVGKTKATPPAEQPKLAVKPTTMKVSAVANPLKDRTPLGFAVVKRGSKTTVGKPKPSVPPPYRAPAAMAAPKSTRPTEANQQKPKLKSAADDHTTSTTTKYSTNRDDALTVAPPPDPSTLANTKRAQSISDIPETVINSLRTLKIPNNIITPFLPTQSFLPPSFPSSQLVTSTPKGKPTSARQKPTSIPHVQPSSPSVEEPTSVLKLPEESWLPSPRVTKVYGRNTRTPSSSPLIAIHSSPSLPAIPISHPYSVEGQATINGTSYLPAIPRPTTPTPPSRKHNGEKRSAPVQSPSSPERLLKKAKTVPDPLSSSPPPFGISSHPSNPLGPSSPGNHRPAPIPVTPKAKQALPTLTELLESSKRGRHTHSPAKGRHHHLHGKADGNSEPPVPESDEVSVATPAPAGVIGNRKEEKEKDKDKATASKAPDSNAPSTSNTHPKPTPIPRFPSPPASIDPDNPYMLDPYALSVDLSLDLDSPTKSLSSLAGSDSDESEQHDLDFTHDVGAFDPLYESTQAGIHQSQSQSQHGATKSMFGWTGYNSQFDIDGQVGEVVQLLENDVDYAVWLRDPSLEQGAP